MSATAQLGRPGPTAAGERPRRGALAGLRLAARPAAPARARARGRLGALRRAAGVERELLPAPHEVAAALWDDGALLWRNFAVTAEEVVLGLCWRSPLGFALAVAIHLSPLLRRAVYPLAVGSQAVPIPVIGVLLVFWWGFGIFPKLVVIALICFFPVLVTTVDALSLPSTPSSSSCCARSTPRAGRRSASPSCRRRCRRRSAARGSRSRSA